MILILVLLVKTFVFNHDYFIYSVNYFFSNKLPKTTHHIVCILDKQFYKNKIVIQEP